LGCPPFPLPPRPPQKPGNLLTRHSYEEQAGRGHKGRALRQPEPPTATPTKEDRTTLKGKEFKGDGATNPHWSGPDARPQSVTDDSLLPLTSRQLAAFQDVFKLFSCSPTGTVDMHSMKMALRHVGMQLGPQEMCEALRLADLDGDGIVSFKDFLGVLTDNHRLAQCMVHMKNSRSYEPQGLQTLFLEVLFKLLSQGFVPFRSRQEMISYYFKKQRALRLSMCGNRRARGQGGRSPYAQIPSLTGRPRPEHRISNRALGSDVRLPKPEKPGRPKLPPSLWPLGKGPLRPPAGLVSQPVEQMRPQKLSPSPTTLVQRHPNSPSPAYFQRSAMKSLYK
ncbi:spermatogenesis-associated protein 21-like, partial [Meriones unguiculatus]|uniref:spermatogenesis-associated protein 21-like n=1 Tax=Meriones unguiculatus TaxID=10047 RepID=UPI00293F3BF1